MISLDSLFCVPARPTRMTKRNCKVRKQIWFARCCMKPEQTSTSRMTCSTRCWAEVLVKYSLTNYMRFQLDRKSSNRHFFRPYANISQLNLANFLLKPCKYFEYTLCSVTPAVNSHEWIMVEIPSENCETQKFRFPSWLYHQAALGYRTENNDDVGEISRASHISNRIDEQSENEGAAEKKWRKLFNIKINIFHLISFAISYVISYDTPHTYSTSISGEVSKIAISYLSFNLMVFSFSSLTFFFLFLVILFLCCHRLERRGFIYWEICLNWR